MTNDFKTEWDNMSPFERNVFVRDHLKSLSRWDLKSILCDVLDVDNYMDDEGLRKEFEKIINER